MEHCNAACEFGQTLLEFLAVVVACGLLDLSLDLSYAGLDGILGTGTVHDGGGFFVNHNLLGAAEIINGC